MDEIKKEKILQRENVNYKNANENMVLSGEDYENVMKHRKKIAILGFSLLFVIEAVIGVFFEYKIISKNLCYRVIKEHEMCSSGEIQLAQGVYYGDTDFGYFDGEGQFDFVTGTEYTGKWKDNQIEGDGTLHIPSEGTYQGEFLASQKCGQGVFTWEDGVVYDGEWKDDQMCGKGTYTTPDGVVYSGTFKNNAFQEGSCSFANSTGSYILTFQEGVIDKVLIEYADESTYEGTCDNFGLNGNGIMTFASGDIYEGAFAEGYRNGQGVYTWVSGDKYVGEWVDDQMSGSGTYTYCDGNYASGTFESNMFVSGSYYVENNFGIYKFTIENSKPIAVEMSLTDGTSYSGDMTDGKLTGEAQIQYSNGDKYSGSVSDGQKSGQGTYNWTSGASYDGKWDEDQMNGTGKYFYSEKEKGYKLSGDFKNGKPDGECQYYVDESTYYKTDWTNGKCVKIYE